MIPTSSILAKMGIYEIEVQGVRIRATVLERASIVDTAISQLRSSLATARRPVVVGLDLKSQTSFSCSNNMLFLCSGTQCLIIHFCYLDNVPDSLKKFLEDVTICFVGCGMGSKVGILGKKFNLPCKTDVELGELAARVLKKPSLLKCGIRDLLRETGVYNTEISKSGSDAGIDLSAKVFTHEEIKLAIQEAYASYAIGTKLLGMI